MSPKVIKESYQKFSNQNIIVLERSHVIKKETIKCFKQ